MLQMDVNKTNLIFCKVFNILCIFIFSATLPYSSCGSQVLNYIEGEEARLNYSYPCDIYDVVIHVGHRAPFYHSTDGGKLLLPHDQEGRFSVRSSNKSENCSLVLTIYNIQRDDAGTYTCITYAEIEKVQDYNQIGVHVEYPPGKAMCSLNGTYQSGGSVSVQCVAPVGSMSGKIDCYQDGNKLDSLTRPFESNASLKQTLLIKHSSFVYCCSTTFVQPKHRCECTDTVIDPVENRKFVASKDICYSTTIAGNSMFPHFTTEVTDKKGDIILASTILSPTNNSIHQNNVFLVSVILILVIIIIMLVCILILKQRRNKEFSPVNHVDKDEDMEKETSL
ncbi:uncharacterized protein LOC121412644 [Lytechinus variegatus]|uniref:uncharacterized protein LOC121412644 n=1 Tax=Lytechinus variegatus TaxID=7654 RepID=UPI001BB137D2|nr:uncharacterized protein LOC121412644 [Lytechinus variegatus]